MSTTRELLNGVSMGAAQSIDELAARLDAVSPERLAAQVAVQTQAREAADRFKAQNADLFSDDLTRKLLFQQDAELQQLRPNMVLEERFALAGQQVRAWLREKRGTTAPKRETAPVRRSASGTQARTQVQHAREAAGWDVAEGDTEENTSAVIAQMAASRRPGGKPVWHPRFETDTPPPYYFDE